MELPQLVRLGQPPDLVSLTVGGNDLLQAYGDTTAARLVVGEVRAGVEQVLARLRDLAPQATVLLGNVYDPSDGSGEAWRVGLPPWPGVVDVLAELNAGLRAAASEHGAAVADIHGRFLGHGLQAGNPGQAESRPANRALWYRDVIEPNAWGADAVRAAFWAALEEHGAGG